MSSISKGTKYGSVRALAVFFLGFVAFWIVAIILIWQLGLVPEPLRRWPRNAIWLGASFAWILWRRPASPMEWLGLWPISLRKFGLAVAGFVSILGWNWLRVNFLATSVNGAAFAEPDLLVWSFIGVFVEELLFRGVVQTQIAETYSALTAILITSVLFLAIHVPGWIILSIPVNAATVATVFLVGLICGAVRQWSKSLWPGVAIHWSNNLGAMF